MNNELGKEIEISISGIRNLIEAIKTAHGFDLGCFALTFFKRSIIRAMQINELKGFDTLTDKLITDKTFFEKFLSDINVECTEFFRDPAFWRYFRDEMLPSLDKKDTRIKIWIPGCSSGEELITSAIIINEAGLKHKTEILATDISQFIIQNLEKRVYSSKNIEISETNYQRFNEGKASLSRHILPVKNGFRIKNDIYENIEFSLYKYQDAQRIRGFNVIIFRNIFIYYTQQYQEMLLGLFANNLAYNGYLVVGNMENISWCKDYYKFTEINKNEKIYKKTG